MSAKPVVIIEQEEGEVYDLVVYHAYPEFPHREVVDLSPNPTWPSPAEANDRIADAVRTVLDKAWESATGEPVER